MAVQACVLPGGGVLGALSVGALLKYFERFPHRRFDYISGISTGALSGGVLAQGRTANAQMLQVELLEDVYRSIRWNRQIYTGATFPPIQLLNLVLHGSFYNPKGLKRLIAKHIDRNTLCEGVPFSCGTAEWETGAYVEWQGCDDDILTGILASASMPGFFPLVRSRRGDFHHCDGGVRNVAPLKAAVKWLAAQEDQEKELWLFATGPLGVRQMPRNTKSKGLKVISRSLEFLVNQIYRHDLSLLAQRNFQPGYSFIRCNIVLPTKHYVSALDFDPDVIAEMLEDGYNLPVHAITAPADLQRLGIID